MYKNNVGKFKLSDSIMISDPCYSVGTRCQKQLDNVLPGEYNGIVVITEETNGWGDRVAELLAIHENTVIWSDKSWEPHNDVSLGVDSGQMGIIDINGYFDDDENPEWYDRICDLTMSQGGIIDGNGVVSSTGYGDGSYDLYTHKNSDGKIDAIRVVFIDDTEE